MELRTKLIRLAHSNPELRKDILPLVSKTAGESWGLGDLTQTQFLIRVKKFESLLDKAAALSLKIDNNGENAVTPDEARRFKDLVDQILSEEQPAHFLRAYSEGLILRTATNGSDN